MNALTEGVKRGRKFDQVLEGAREVFMRDGFEGASVDSIAAAAGVSKATLYSYFPDKKLLFMEVAKTECGRQADAAISKVDPTLPAEQVLTFAARTMVQFLFSDFGLQTFRIAVAESGRFPEIGREFYASGPARAQAVLAEYLEARVAAGELRIDDIELAAAQFPELCKASLHTKLILGLKSGVSQEEIDRVIAGAVEVFMARYRA
ncbi:MAG: TetR/AcrR family transcriptional regulator [Rhodobacteraceae bacterium]|nr:TetR/AcrR family transcriptional regulator [Paracoccaceae bacterium]